MTDLALALSILAALACALTWAGRRLWLMYRHHFGIEGPVWMARHPRD